MGTDSFDLYFYEIGTTDSGNIGTSFFFRIVLVAAKLYIE
jgi:hypothetical protein